jgi:LacI family transcriptional regulator
MGRLRKVAVFIESSRSSGRGLLRGIARYSRLHGPWSFLWGPRGLEEALPQLGSWTPDGIIARDSVLDVAAHHNVPMVIVGHSRDFVSGVANIITHSEAIGALAAQHLLDCGLRSFAYCGLPSISWSRARSDSFGEAVEKAGFAVSVYPLRGGRRVSSWQGEISRMSAWLKSLPLPVGLMACNDDRAHQVAEVCKIVGLRVPEDVAVIGVDNDELVCGLASPPLSSISIDFEQAGFEGAGHLDGMMSGVKREHHIISAHPTHIVPRHSTDMLAVEDENVALALRFIRKNRLEPIRVGDVAKASYVSRRVLEKRFRATLGRSVMREIRRVRTDEIARLLVEEDVSILQIALRTGFRGVEHFARYFRSEKGVSPLAFRRSRGRWRWTASAIEEPRTPSPGGSNKASVSSSTP